MILSARPGADQFGEDPLQGEQSVGLWHLATSVKFGSGDTISAAHTSRIATETNGIPERNGCACAGRSRPERALAGRPTKRRSDDRQGGEAAMNEVKMILRAAR
jgi:hypothetical protein